MTPETNTIRSAEAADAREIASIKIDSWRVAYKGIVSDGLLAGLKVDDVSRRWLAVDHDELATHGIVAVCEGAVAGYALFGEPHDSPPGWDAQLYEIYVRPGKSRTGIGRALFREAAARLCARGHSAMALWVFAANIPAHRFYERLGGVPIPGGTQVTTMGDRQLDEIAYGFRPLAAFK